MSHGRQLIELQCSRELALWLGAILPVSPEQHRAFRASGHYIMIRERVTLEPMFWLAVELPELGL